MEVSDKFKEKALLKRVDDDEGHWRSLLAFDKTRRVHRLNDGPRRTSHLLVLWHIFLGDPVGLLSNACGRSECVNPYHYKDESDRQQADWRAEECNGKELLDHVADDEGNRFMQIVDIVLKSDILISNVYGMTNDMGCYHCGKRFDPLAHRNQVVCPECWTDEDQAKAEANLVD